MPIWVLAGVEPKSTTLVRNCLVPRPLAVFHLGQFVLDHVVRAAVRLGCVTETNSP